MMKPYDNRGLFAEHFLKDRLPQLEEWKQARGLEGAFEAVLEIYSSQAAKFTHQTNEAQTEHGFIQPVLNLLWREKENDCYQVQVSIPNSEGRGQPDYAFFQTAKERDDAEERKGTLEYWRDAPALGDAKAWSASLDKKRGVHENPSAQICSYLYRSRVRWGILTNGQVWRLYERERSSTGGVFYEVNLKDLLEQHDTEAFKYFYLFFRREAFLPDQKGTTFIERVFQGSVDYAAEVGDRLKESVYDALCILMNGFFEHPANELDRRDPDALRLVHENCLIVLYRLLFLLYAEDRLLLPRNTEPYADYSLYARQQEINQHLRSGDTYLLAGQRFWGELTSLFGLIDRGSPEASVPAYNGGLFSPSNHPHIAHTPQPGAKRWEIGDRYLAEAIDLLSFERERRDQAGTRRVDYATLDVQHLGSIYEGLLELQPRISDEGEIYLATDRGERKATGSYYTPKYIVQYIVENTVGPLAEEAEKQVREMRPEVDRGIAKLERDRREWEESPAPGAAKQIEGIDKLIEEQKRCLLEPYLSLKILDPAMGSGHFLVGAADFLSLAMATDPYLLPMDEVDNEDPQAFYKRLVVERCLYGVDLNALAVELARLSLWLHTVSRDRALSFLDHHLRCGNSLIGARIEDDLTQTPPELDTRGRIKKRDTRQLVLGFTETLTATHLSYFLDTFRKIMETPTGDAETERMKDRWYREMDSVRDRFRSAANCWLAPYFGASVTPEQYERAVKALRGADTQRQALAEEKWFRDAQAVAHQKRFFHWELEFPEVFFTAQGFKPSKERGFHAVIGNPPYGDILSSDEKQYLSDRGFEAGGSGNNDVFRFFVENGATLAIQRRSLSFIIPNSCLAGTKYRNYRKSISGLVTVLGILDFKTCKHFEADVFTHILVLRNERSTKEYTCWYIAAPDGEWHGKPAVEIDMLPASMDSWLPSGELHKRLSGSVYFRKLSDIGDSRDAGINYQRHGVGWQNRQPSDVAARVFYDGNQDDARDMQYLKGTDIGRYLISPKKRRWLRHSYADLVFDGESVSVNHEWAAKSPKILTRQTGDSIIAAVDYYGFYTGRSLHSTIIVSSDYSVEFLCALLNCKLVAYFYHQLSQEEGRAQAQVNLTNLRQIPIRRIAFTTPPEDRARLLEKGKRFYTGYLSHGDADRVLGFVGHQLAQTPERSDVVRDLLAFLAERMMEMSKEKQAEIREFLKWLGRYMGAEIDGLKNKTRLHAYHEYDPGTLLDLLRQNRRKLEVDPATRDFQEDFEGEYNNSMIKLAPLKAKIAATDRLIDLIVYRLYGLSEEEMAIVEESMSMKGYTISKK